MDATLESLDIAHGSVVYAPLEEVPERAPLEEPEAFYSPYPALAKKTTLARGRRRDPRRASTKDRRVDAAESDVHSLTMLAISSTPAEACSLLPR